MTSLKGQGLVEFRFFRPGVSKVSIAGDFNDWRDGVLPMEPAPEGWWTLTAKLHEGEHRFRYIADGRWFTDFAANGVEASPLGWNAVIVVPASKQPQDAQHFDLEQS